MHIYACAKVCVGGGGGGRSLLIFVVVNYCGDRVAVPLLGPPRPGNWRESPLSETSLER